jgi:hypothetical protein
MQKPEGYDAAPLKQFFGSQRPQAGAYVMKIKSAVDTTSSSGRPMLIVFLDIAQGQFTDNFKTLFEKLKENNPGTKWPCIHRRCTDGNQLEYFKGDIKAIEESNEGFKFNFDEKTLSGKLVGCMLREKEYGQNEDGSAKTILEPAFLCSIKTALSGKLNPMKMKPMNSDNAQDNGFKDSKSDNLPF